MLSLYKRSLVLHVVMPIVLLMALITVVGKAEDGMDFSVLQR